MSVSFSKTPLQLCLEGRFTMVGSEELLCALITFVRGNLQDFVARSSDLSDASTYLLAELNLELARATSFKKKAVFRYQPNQAANHCHQNFSGETFAA